MLQNIENDQLSGAHVRQVLRRVLRSTTQDIAASSSSSNDVSDDSHVVPNADRGKDRRRDVNSTRLQDAVEVAATHPYIDYYSIVRNSDHLNRKCIGRKCQGRTVVDKEITASTEDGTHTSGNSTWSATLIRSLDFRRIAIEDLPSNVTSPPGQCRSVYVTIDTTSGEGRPTTVSAVVLRSGAPAEKNGYSYTTRRSASFGVGDNRSSQNGTGLSTTLRDRHPIGNLSQSNELTVIGDQRREYDSDRRVVQNNERDAKASRTNPPPIPPKPKRVIVSLTKTKPQQSASDPRQAAENWSKTQHAAKETVPPPLPARVNLVNLRQGALPPPPPPPRKTDSPLFGHVPPWTSHGFTANVQRLPSHQLDNCNKPTGAVITDATAVGISSTAATSSISSDGEASGGDEVDDEVDLDYIVSASSSLTNLSCVVGSGHPLDQEHGTTRKKSVKEGLLGAVEDDDYEPITPRDETRVDAVRSPWSKTVTSETVSPASISQVSPIMLLTHLIN